MKYLLDFNQSDDRWRVGGKAHGLHRLVAWGFEVPPGFVVPADIYRDAALSEPVGPLIRDFALRENVAGPPRLDDQMVVLGKIRGAIERVELPAGLREDLAEGWLCLAAAASGTLAVACRSSGVDEDSSFASFAGQHATVLGITDLEGIGRAIQKCWASLWTEQAVAYRRRSGRPVAPMAVVVQRMARAEVSGVAFSINPVTGNPGEVVINSTWGLGEMVVSGTVTPDTFIVDKRSGQVVASEISTDKSIGLFLQPDGSVGEEAIPPARSIAPTLDSRQIAAVASAVATAEANAGTPQDIEWVFESGKLLLLQARPITATSRRP